MSRGSARARPRVLATLCARGGSRGVPGKNVRPLAGRPLLAYTVECALSCPAVDRLIVSTDSEEIAQVARSLGVEVPFRRPPEMATDRSGKIDAIRHATLWVEEHEGFVSDVVVDLDITSPLRAPEDVTACIETLWKSNADALVSVYPAEKSPYFNMVELDESGRAQLVKPAAAGLLRRQDAPAVYSVSGAVFAFRRDRLMTTTHLFAGHWAACVLPRERAFDIDDEMDFRFAEFLVAAPRAPEGAP